MTVLLFSCDYATCAVPEAYRELFHGAEDIVTSPEGWDPGALNLAQGFSIKFRTPMIHGQYTRLPDLIPATGIIFRHPIAADPADLPNLSQLEKHIWKRQTN